MKLIADPLKKYTHVKKGELINGCGLIPYWVMRDQFDLDNFLDIFNANYQFGIHEMTGGEILEDGTYTYPEDDDLYPLIKIEAFGETMYQYNYGIVAVIHADGSQFVTRMD